MKIIKFVLVSLFLTVSAFGQHTGNVVPINDVITFQIPLGSKEISLDKLKSATVPGKSSELNTNKLRGSYYKSDESLLILTGAVSNQYPEFLEDWKKVLDELNKETKTKNYSSEIKSLNNYKVLIQSHDGKDFSYLRFNAVSNSQNATIGGIIEFNSTHKDKVRKLLDEFLTNLKFKQ